MLLNPSLQLPEENEFIPTDFTIRERPQDVRTKMTAVQLQLYSHIFSKQDNDNKQPQSSHELRSYEATDWEPGSQMCGFIAHLVEHRTGISGGHEFESH